MVIKKSKGKVYIKPLTKSTASLQFFLILMFSVFLFSFLFVFNFTCTYIGLYTTKSTLAADCWSHTLNEPYGCAMLHEWYCFKIVNTAMSSAFRSPRAIWSSCPTVSHLYICKTRLLSLDHCYGTIYWNSLSSTHSWTLKNKDTLCNLTDMHNRLYA